MFRFRPLMILMCLAVMQSVSAAEPGTKPVGPSMNRAWFFKSLWIIETHTQKGVKIPEQLLQEHVRNQMRLEKEGILFAAGPVETAGEADFGRIVVRAANREEARKIADSDPLHQAGLRHYILREWFIGEGRLSIDVDYSDGAYQFE